MVYKIVKSDELYHHGVKGMRWGVRKEKTNNSSQKKKMSTATKVAIGVGAAVAVGAAAYGVSKWRGKAIDSLSKDAIKQGRKYIDLSLEGHKTADHIMNNADKAKLRGSLETMKFQEELAKNTRRSAEALNDKGFDLLEKGKNKRFTNREVAGEMKRMASERFGKASKDYSKYKSPYKLTGYSKRGNRAMASFNKERFYNERYKANPSTKNWVLRDLYSHEEATPMYSWKTHSGRPRKLRKR